MHVTRRIVAGIALVSMGCYTYAPTTLDSVPLNAEVSALLSTEAQISLEERTGLQTRELRGELVDRNADIVLIAVPSTGPFTGEQLRQRVDVAPRDILRMEVRRPAPARTAGLMTALVGVGVLIVVLATGESNPGSTPTEPPGGIEHVGRSLSVPFVRQ